MQFDYDRLLHYWANRFCILIRKELQGRFRDSGENITPEEWAILFHLWKEDGQTPSRLADATFRDRTTLTRIVDGMVKKELLRREVDPADRRRVQVLLAERGQAIQATLVPIARKLIGETLSDIPESEIEITRKVLRRMSTTLMDMRDRS